jgi:hypothetical protein
MFARNVAVDDVNATIENGEIIASYPDDSPYPSDLMLGVDRFNRPLHVVLAYNKETRTAYVVTAYVPDPKLWTEDLKRRREQ